MKKYKIAIWEEVSGFIDVDADTKEKAEEIAEDDYHVELSNAIFHYMDDWEWGMKVYRKSRRSTGIDR